MEQRGDVGTGLLSDSVPFVSQVLSFIFPCVLQCPQKMSLIICPVGQRLWRPELHMSSFVRRTQPGLDMEFVTAECKVTSAGHEVTTVSECFILLLPGTLLIVSVFFAFFLVFPFARLYFWQSWFFHCPLANYRYEETASLFKSFGKRPTLSWREFCCARSFSFTVGFAE